MKIRKLGIGAASLAVAGTFALGGLTALGASAQTPEATPQGQERPSRSDGPRPEGSRPGRGGAHSGVSVRSAAAEVLGIEKDALKAELEAGKTLAVLGEEHGFTRDELKEAITEVIEQKLAQAVTDGTITAEKQAEVLAGLSERIDTALDASYAGKTGRGFGGDGSRFHGERPDGAGRGPRSSEGKNEPGS